MGRPRVHVDLPEDRIVESFTTGTPIAALAAEHGVDRTVIRRVIRENDPGAAVLQFPKSREPIAPPGFVTSTDLIARTRITYRQLDYWTRVGLLQPSTQANPGSGNARFYPVEEVAFARLLRQLLDAGVNLRPAVDLARDLLEQGHSQLGGIRIDLPQDL